MGKEGAAFTPDLSLVWPEASLPLDKDIPLHVRQDVFHRMQSCDPTLSPPLNPKRTGKRMNVFSRIITGRASIASNRSSLSRPSFSQNGSKNSSEDRVPISSDSLSTSEANGLSEGLSHNAAEVSPFRSKSKQHWMDDKSCKTCFNCATTFTTFVRKHHCRVCGRIFCSKCSKCWIVTEHEDRARVCDACFEVHGMASSDNLSTRPSSSMPAMELSSNKPLSTNFHRDATGISVDGGAQAITVAPDDRQETEWNQPEQPRQQNITKVRVDSNKTSTLSSMGGSSPLPRLDEESGTKDLSKSTEGSIRNLDNSSFTPPVIDERRVSLDPKSSPPKARLENNTSKSKQAEENVGKGEVWEWTRRHFSSMLSHMLDKEGIPDNWHSVVIQLVHEIMTCIVANVRHGDKTDVRHYVKVKCIPGGQMKDSSVVHGVVFRKNVAHKQMSSSIESPKLLLLKCALEYEREGRLANFMTLMDQEKEFLTILSRKIAAVKPDVVIVAKSAARWVQQELLAAGVSLVVNVKDHVIDWLARCTRSNVLLSTDRVSASSLGKAGKFMTRYMDSRKAYMYVEGCQEQLFGTIVLRGADYAVLKKVKRVIRFCLFAHQCMLAEATFMTLLGTFVAQPASSHSTQSTSAVMAANATDSGNGEDCSGDSVTHMLLSMSPFVCFRLPPEMSLVTFSNTGQACTALPVEGVLPGVVSEGQESYPRLWGVPGLELESDSQNSIRLLQICKTRTASSDCGKPLLQKYSFLSDTDMTLGQFLESMCFSPSATCPGERCRKLMLDHERSFVHCMGRVNIMINKRDAPAGFSPTQLVIRLSQASINPAGKRLAHQARVMTLAEWEMSFSRFLEMALYNRCTRCSTCSSLLFKEHVWGFFYCGLAVMIFVEETELLEILAPPPVFPDSDKDGAAIILDVQDISESGSTLYGVIMRRLLEVQEEVMLRRQQLEITQLIDRLKGQLSRLKSYVSFIASRPRVEAEGGLAVVKIVLFELSRRLSAVFETSSVDRIVLHIRKVMVKGYGGAELPWMTGEGISSAGSDLFGLQERSSSAGSVQSPGPQNSATAIDRRVSVVIAPSNPSHMGHIQSVQSNQLLPTHATNQGSSSLPSFAWPGTGVDDAPEQLFPKLISPLSVSKLGDSIQARNSRASSFIGWSQKQPRGRSVEELDEEDVPSDVQEIECVVENLVSSVSTGCGYFSHPGFPNTDGQGHKNNCPPGAWISIVPTRPDEIDAMTEVTVLHGFDGPNSAQDTDGIKTPGRRQIQSHVYNSDIGTLMVLSDMEMTATSGADDEECSSIDSESSGEYSACGLGPEKLGQSIDKSSALFACPRLGNSPTLEEGDGVGSSRELTVNAPSLAKQASLTSLASSQLQKPAVATGETKSRRGKSELHSGPLLSDIALKAFHVFQRGGDDGGRSIFMEDEVGSILIAAMKTKAYKDRLSDALAVRSSFMNGQHHTITADMSGGKEPKVVRDHGTPTDTPSSAARAQPPPSTPVTHASHVPAKSDPIKIMFSSIGGAGQTNFTVKVLFPAEFHALRQRCMGNDDAMFTSLRRCKDWAATGGKSKSTFIKTSDDKLIIKHILKAEIDALDDFIPEYVNHMLRSQTSTEGPRSTVQESLLVRVVGAFKVSMTNVQSGKTSKQTFVVMENIFMNCDLDNMEVYDLKGSERNRRVRAARAGQVLMDDNFLEATHNNPAFLRLHSKQRLMKSIFHDSSFLSRQGIMDYSLLVGIHRTERRIVVGIIDCFRKYTWDKALENKIKSAATVSGKAPTVLPPKDYEKRFCDAMERYFLVVPDKFSGHDNDTDEFLFAPVKPGDLQAHSGHPNIGSQVDSTGF